MVTIKSFSVGEGDMFYIKHDSDNFTTIDCCLPADPNVKDPILSEIRQQSQNVTNRRFISTHPDKDHILGLSDLDDEFKIVNFYRVDNKVAKGASNKDFEKYRSLRDRAKNTFSLEKDCSRKWFNRGDEIRKSSNLECLWPILSNKKFQEAQEYAKNGVKINNISPVIRHQANDSFSFLWMGDLETQMQELFDCQVECPKTTIVFAPHHGRLSGTIPESLLKKISPKMIIIGEGPSDNLNYYSGYNTITQNSAGDIRFDIEGTYINIYVSNKNYNKMNGLTKRPLPSILDGMYYLGSIMGGM